MKREIETDFLQWKNHPNHLPLLLRGARQVGKSYIVEKFGNSHFSNTVTINFELQSQFINCFNELSPKKIITSISALTKQQIIPGETLLFLDEIQECPNAIMALRYFKEQMPALHVIGAGSLLEFTLKEQNFRMPVGRVQSLYLKPLSFIEFLRATKNQLLIEHMEAATLKHGIDTVIHEHLLKLLHEYMMLGGMPEVIQNYLDNKDLYQVQLTQSSLLNTYRNDFGKYSKHVNYKVLQQVFDKAPGLVSQHFKYIKINPDILSRDIKPALTALEDAGLIYPVYCSNAAGIPLNTGINEKKFKLLFVDIGLVKNATELDAELLLSNDILLLNRGALAEQFVGQELLAYKERYRKSSLYYWERDARNSSAEVDFIINKGPDIFPIEVKAGTSGTLKSMKIFMQEKKSILGIRISQKPLSLEHNILSIPLYMIKEIPRLIAEAAW
ncbi:MAG: AAA family ATPase [Gammaproteobacteria bacterium]|nr:AAA family ATPase [Gammaproteobacteria bacterium]